jgi:hypothetical protein
MKYSGSKNKHPNNKSQAFAWLLFPPFLNTDAKQTQEAGSDPTELKPQQSSAR